MTKHDSTKHEEEKIEHLENVENLKKDISEEKSKAEKYLCNWQLAEADFRNYKKRTDQERSEIARNTIGGIICNILPVLDDFELALKNIPKEKKDMPWLEGIRLIKQKLFSILEIQGMSVMDALGQDFDPVYHDAVGYSDGEDGKVVEIVRTGYKLNDRILRPAMVIVGKSKGDQDK